MAPADQVLEHWRFTKEQKDANYAVIRRSSDAFSGKAALELTLREDIPYVGDNSIEICPIFEGMSGGRGDCFLPPETDAVRVRIKAPEVGLSPRQARGSAGLCASHFLEGAIALAVELRSRHFTGALSRVAKSGGLAPEVGLSPRADAGLCERGCFALMEGAIARAVELRSRHFTGALSRVAKSGGLAPEVGLEATTSRADY